MHVVHGVLGALLAGQIEVEVDRRVVRAGQQEPARRVDADLGDQLVEADELARALGHLRPLAALHQVDELHDDQLELVAVTAERLEHRLDALDIAMVVGAPDVDQPVEAALALVDVVRDVRREVRVLAVGALDDAILVVPVLGCLHPQGALGAVDLE